MNSEQKCHTTEQIVAAAKDASAWCNLKWDLENIRSCLRNLEFSPEFFGRDHFYTVDSMINARRFALEDQKEKSCADLTGGRILVYEPDMNIFDGLSEAETKGYVDVNDCPPWDTWVGYIASVETRWVLSWVPSTAISLVNEGAEVNCTDCFYWLSELDTSWAKEIMRA